MRTICVVILALGLSFTLGCGGAPSGSPLSRTAASAPSSGASAPATGALFPSAAWLYHPPAGPALNISGMASGLTFHLNTRDGGFDYPVAYADGSHGCTTFTDTRVLNYHDHICVPNPAGGFHPATGAWGADDGHLIVVAASTGTYYDFWKLSADANGQPLSTNVGQIVSGSLGGNGTPGTTAAGITGLAGDILPGELDCATCLRHALSVVVPGTLNSPQVGHQAPAEKTDGTVPGAIFREGAKIRFDPSVNVDALSASTAVKAILHALQNYGGVIVDQTGGTGVTFYTALPVAPDLTGINLIGHHLWIYY